MSAAQGKAVHKRRDEKKVTTPGEEECGGAVPCSLVCWALNDWEEKREGKEEKGEGAICEWWHKQRALWGWGYCVWFTRILPCLSSPHPDIPSHPPSLFLIPRGVAWNSLAWMFYSPYLSGPLSIRLSFTTFSSLMLRWTLTHALILALCD